MITQENISSIIYSPQKRKEALYSFENSIDSSEGKNKTKPKYFGSKVKIRCIGYDVAHYYFQLKVIESIYRGSSMRKLFRKVNMAFDHIVITVNKKGLITRVNNLEVIRENWLKQKENLKKEYEGGAVLKLFKSIDSTLRTERKLVKVLQHPKMYGSFFNGYWRYDKSNPDTGTKLNVKSEEGTTTVKVTHTDNESDYKGHFLYRNNSLLESNIILNNIKYNALCLG